MAGTNRPARLNRTVLALLGLVLLVGGGGLAALGLGLLAALPAGLPGGIGSRLDPTVPLLPADPSLPAWATYAAIAVAVVVGLACLRWLLAQTQRRPRAGTWTLPVAARAGVADPGTTRIGTSDAADAVAADVGAYSGVGSVTADLIGGRDRPTLQLRVTAGQDTSVRELRRQIEDHALPRLRRALDLDGIDTRLVLTLDPTPPARAR